MEQPTNVEEKNKFDYPLLQPGQLGITYDEMSEIMDFDARDDPSHLELINSRKFGGVEGIAHLLWTELKVTKQY